MKTFYPKLTLSKQFSVSCIHQFISVFLLFFFIINSFLSTAQVNVVTQHNNLKRTGWNSNETQLTQSSISGGNFGKIFTRQVDDQIYAQPLIMSNVSINGGTHNIVLVATVNNSVYAFDADDSSITAPYWKQSLSYPGYRAITSSDYPDACAGNYTDFSGRMGIVGTPVIDSTTNTLYVVVKSTDNGTNFVQYLHAISIIDGSERPGSPVYITATVPGTGDGTDGTNVPFHERQENQRPGLLLYNGVVYIAWASYCDLNPYHGWVLGYDATTLAQKYVYNDTRNGGLGGIWMSGQAPAVDDNGFIYVSSGNGETTITGSANDSSNRPESLIKLSTASGALKVADFFTPDDYNYMDINDLDYGVDGVMLIPNTNLSLSGSKESYLYMIDNTKMGGATTDNSNVVELINVNASSVSPDKHIHGSPVYFQDNNSNEYIYAWAEDGFLKQFPFKRPALFFDTLNQIIGNTQLPSGMPGAMLAISSNGLQEGSGILWASHPINGDASNSVVPGILQAFDATNITHELWNSNMSGIRDSLGRFAKFVVPTIANGKVYMATFSNQLVVYGLNPRVASKCPYPLPSPWVSADIGYLTYPGDVCDNSGVYTVTSSGSDIWNIADAFHYVYQPAVGSNVKIVARVVSVQNTNQWAKAGVMFRSSFDAGSANIFMAISSSNGATFQTRTGQNYGTLNTSQSGPVAPYWVKITGTGNKYVGYTSPDGTNWTAVDSTTIALGSTPYVGLAYTSHDTSQSGIAVFDNVSVTNNGVLAIDLLSFSAQNISNKYGLLNWSAANGSNIDHFDIERSSTSTNFTAIGTIKSVDDSSLIQNYAFNDMSPLDGTNFYRLKEVDVNGQIQYSKVIPVQFNFKLIDIFPNPANGELFIRNNSNFSGNQNLIIQVSDESGNVVLKQVSASSGNNIIPVNLSGVVRGMYFVKVLNTKGEMQARKILVNR